MSITKQFLKKILPGLIIRKCTGLFYGWYGSHSTWEEAYKNTTGYDSKLILEKVKYSMLQVKNGVIAYEKDSIQFDNENYSYPLLSGLLWIASQNNGKLRVMDFGGSLGSSYYQHKRFLDELPNVKWCVVEQPNFVKAGKENFTDERLEFYNTIDECLQSNEIDIVLLSSVLQYIEKPYDLLDQIKKTSIEYIIIDRTAFIEEDDRITIQKVNPKIYTASYPSWFFNAKKFKNYMAITFDSIYEFESPDRSNIKSKFKGFLFKKRDINPK